MRLGGRERPSGKHGYFQRREVVRRYEETVAIDGPGLPRVLGSAKVEPEVRSSEWRHRREGHGCEAGLNTEPFLDLLAQQAPGTLAVTLRLEVQPEEHHSP